MLPDATFFIWMDPGGIRDRLVLSHAPCGETLIESSTNLDMDKVLAAITAHNCPGIVPVEEGSPA